MKTVSEHIKFWYRYLENKYHYAIRNSLQKNENKAKGGNFPRKI